MIIRFVYYMHDSGRGDEVLEDIRTGVGNEDIDTSQFTDELAEKIGRPFYEVALDCTLNTETGAVVIHGVRGDEE